VVGSGQRQSQRRRTREVNRCAAPAPVSEDVQRRPSARKKGRVRLAVPPPFLQPKTKLEADAQTESQNARAQV
jgi:hypothetical protein